SSEQITSLLLGEENVSDWQHLGECAKCRAELDELQNAFTMYRDAGRNWSEHCRTQTSATGLRTRPPKFRWWAASGGLAVAGLAVALLIHPSAPPMPV